MPSLRLLFTFISLEKDLIGLKAAYSVFRNNVIEEGVNGIPKCSILMLYSKTDNDKTKLSKICK